MKTETADPNDLIPYKRNTKKHTDEQISNVAASIKKYGFVQPIVVDKNNVIVIGHSRTLAAKKLGLKEVPIVRVDALTDEEVKALRIADNKLNESSWDKDMLELELDGINFEDFGFDFDFTNDTKRHKAWDHVSKRCNLQKKITQSDKGSFIYTSFYRTSKDGYTLEEIKDDRDNVELFAYNLIDYVEKYFGRLNDTWCILTTPRRRHKDFHFATAICELAAEELGISFYKDAIVAADKDRFNPYFAKRANPPEDNIILYDDIISTGRTIEVSRELFADDHCVIPIIAIRNNR